MERENEMIVISHRLFSCHVFNGKVVDLPQYVVRYPPETLNVRCRISPGHQSLFLSPRDGKEVFEDLAAHRGHDGLGMELEAEDGAVLV